MLQYTDLTSLQPTESENDNYNEKNVAFFLGYECVRDNIILFPFF